MIDNTESLSNIYKWAKENQTTEELKNKLFLVKEYPKWLRDVLQQSSEKEIP
jgi:hypothetical protein